MFVKIYKILQRATKNMIPASQEFIVLLESPNLKEKVASSTGHAAWMRPSKGEWTLMGGGRRLAGWRALEWGKEEGKPAEGSVQSKGRRLERIHSVSSGSLREFQASA